MTEFNIEEIRKLTAMNKEKVIKKHIKSTKFWIRNRAKHGFNKCVTDNVPDMAQHRVREYFEELGFDVRLTSWGELVIEW